MVSQTGTRTPHIIERKVVSDKRSYGGNRCLVTVSVQLMNERKRNPNTTVEVPRRRWGCTKHAISNNGSSGYASILYVGVSSVTIRKPLKNEHRRRFLEIFILHVQT